MCVPVVAFLAELLFEMAESEAVGLHESAVRDLLATEEIGDHQLRARVGAGVSGTQPPLLLPPLEKKYRWVKASKVTLISSIKPNIK